ncbi:hypothetical protein CU014_1626 [Enterococcus xinjiangensis]|nr:hypothetical protein [Enterococcus lactis]
MKSYTFSLINEILVFVLFYLFVNKFTSKKDKNIFYSFMLNFIIIHLIKKA